MENFKVQTFSYLFLTILQLCTDHISAQITLDTLSCLCGLRNGTNIVRNIPNGCKTVVVPTKQPVDIAAVNLIKGTASILMIEDSYKYDNWLTVVQADASVYSESIQPLNVDAIAFEFMYSDKLTALDRTFTNALIVWLDQLKCLNPCMMFGIVLPTNVDFIYNSMDIELLNCHVDFFILNSEWYEHCLFLENQEEMQPRVPLNDLKQNINDIGAKGLDLKKLIYTLYIRVYSVNNVDGQSTWEDYDYSTLCSRDFEDTRRFCVESTENIFNKARLRIELGLLGVFVRDIEMDDIQGTCKCEVQISSYATSTTFPELNIIVQASQESVHSLDYYQCKTGTFPIIL